MKRAKSIENFGRAPVPEWEELARAAWPGSVPMPVSQFFAKLNLTVFVLGLIALLTAAWLHLPWLALGAWLVTAGADWLSTRADPPATRLLDLIGLRPQARALLRSALAAAVIFTSGLPNADTAGLSYISAVMFIQLAWFVQPTLATWVWRSAPPLQYLPQRGDQPRSMRRYAAIYGRAVGTPVVMLLLELIVLLDAVLAEYQPKASILVLLGLTVAGAAAETALIYLGWTAYQAFTARRDAADSAQRLVGALSEKAPSFVVYVSLGARQAKYIVNQWLPTFEKLSQDGLLIVREASQLAELETTRHPVIYAPSQRDVEMLIVPSVKAAFYLAFGERNGQLQLNPNLKHVMLLHGESDKATSANNLARGMSEVWVAGQVAVDRYLNAGVDLPPERFAIVGRPQSAELPVGPTGNKHPIVLYAPTFEGYYEHTYYTSLDRMGVRIVRKLLRDYPDLRVWFRPHPASGVRLPAMLTAITEISTILRRAGAGHRVTADDDLSLTECLSSADILISDISSVATDYLYTERPVITANPQGLSQAEFVGAFPTQASSYLIGANLEGLNQAIDLALGEDPLAAARLAMKKRVLGDTPDGPQAAFAANVSRLIGTDPA